MDQAKWSIPRSRETRSAKAILMLPKPRFKIQGVWIQNVCLDMYVIDCRTKSDASTVLECGLRSIEGAMKKCDDQGKPRPDQAIIWEAYLNSKKALYLTTLNMQGY